MINMNDYLCSFCIVEVYLKKRAENAVNPAVTLVMGNAVCRHHTLEGLEEGGQALSESITEENTEEPSEGGDLSPEDLPDGLNPDDLMPPADEQPSMYRDRRE